MQLLLDKPKLKHYQAGTDAEYLDFLAYCRRLLAPLRALGEDPVLQNDVEVNDTTPKAASLFDEAAPPPPRGFSFTNDVMTIVILRPAGTAILRDPEPPAEETAYAPPPSPRPGILPPSPPPPTDIPDDLDGTPAFFDELSDDDLDGFPTGPYDQGLFL